MTLESVRLEIPYERKSYVCTHVFDRSRPVLLVTRPDGDFCALCGYEHPEDANPYRVVGFGHVLDDDSSVAEVLDPGPNQEAERAAVGEPWVRSEF